MAGNLSDYSRKDLLERISSLEYALAELEHRLGEDTEEWEVVQDAKAPGWFTVKEEMRPAACDDEADESEIDYGYGWESEDDDEDSY